MKTIVTVFTQEYQEMPMGRRYSFNTNLDVEEGDLIVSPDYHCKLLQVVAVEKKVYQSFSYSKGELFEEVIEQKGYGRIKLLGEDSYIYTEDDSYITTEDGNGVEIPYEAEEDEGF
jgi:hypothetical protein